ncbi:MAG: ABC transporter permease [Anaerolineae bacterium]|nr:ABC transporter permease [Anaerolineae bacterium]
MPSLIKFMLRRLAAIPVTLLLITAVLYGLLMFSPATARAQLYMPRGQSHNPNLRPEVLLEQIIVSKGLRDPFPLQYARWAGNLLRGDWGWSPSLRGDVLEGLFVRTPATAELTLYSVILLLPLGVLSGVIAGIRTGCWQDYLFRTLAFIATAIPPFILGIVLLTVFYAGLQWFPVGRIGMADQYMIQGADFRVVTGLLTVDGLLNGMPALSLRALWHLILPAFTLSLLHWATLGRITRAAVLEELDKDYIIAANGRGLPQRWIVWRHILKNAMAPALNSVALSAAALITGVYLVEKIFALPGISEFIVGSVRGAPDLPMAMGAAVYSVLMILPMMLSLDVLQAMVDPRLREGLMS